MESLEFYNFEDEVWVRRANGESFKYTESCKELTKFLIDQLSEFYPKALKALQKEYQPNSVNPHYYQFRMSHRFCKCNFGEIDNKPDYVDSRFNLERVACPLRGECKLENVVCNPEFNAQISPAEMRVLEYKYRGNSHEDIADALCLSPLTVRNHIRSAMARTKSRTVADLIKYIAENELIKPTDL